MPLAPDEMQALFTDALGEHVEGSQIQWDQLTVTLDAEGYVEAARLARDDERLACDLFDCISGVDEREDGFSVVTILYSTEHHHRVLLKHMCDGGREKPVAPSLTDLYRGADWHEREAWDMFGIEFEGHPGLAPRILTTENFEGWPLRKDFYLASREAKPWPGIKEPQELDEEGNVIERELTAEPGAAPGPMELDEAMAEQAKRAAGLLDQETVEVEAGDVEKEVEAEAPRTTATGSGVGATPEEAASTRAERARQKAREMRAEKGRERETEQAEQAEQAEEEQEPPADEVSDEVATAQDPRVTSPEDRGEGEGEGAGHAKRQPDTRSPGEETRSERAERAIAEEQEPPQPAQREDAGGPPATSPPDGTDASAGTPEEAPVEAGLRESADEAADAGPGPSGGERPGTDDATDVDDPMPDDAADRSRTLPEDPSSSGDSGGTPDPSSSSDSGRTADPSSTSDSGRTRDDEDDEDDGEDEG